MTASMPIRGRRSAKVGDRAVMEYENAVSQALAEHPLFIDESSSTLRRLGEIRCKVLEAAKKLAEKQFPIKPGMAENRQVNTRHRWLNTYQYSGATSEYDDVYREVPIWKRILEAHEMLLRHAGHLPQADRAQKLLDDAWAIHPEDSNADEQLAALEAQQESIKNEETARLQAEEFTQLAQLVHDRLPSLVYP